MISVQKVENETIKQGKNLVKRAIYNFLNKSYNECITLILEAQELFIQQKSSENISVCLSIIGLVDYLQNIGLIVVIMQQKLFFSYKHYRTIFIIIQ